MSLACYLLRAAPASPECSRRPCRCEACSRTLSKIVATALAMKSPGSGLAGTEELKDEVRERAQSALDGGPDIDGKGWADMSVLLGVSQEGWGRSAVRGRG